MLKQLLSGKIHTARLTHCEINYEGSLEIDQNYLDMAKILPYEKILVVNRNNGSRFFYCFGKENTNVIYQ